MAKPERLKNLIGGEWLEPRSGAYLERHNPADSRELVATYPASNAEDAEAAIAAAQKAYPAWRLTPAPRRAEILYRAAELLVQRKEAFAREMTREMGKVLVETRGDVQEAIDMLYFMAGEGRRLYGQTTPSELANKVCMTTRSPIGVAGLITPWNFPMAIPSWKLAPCLLCGNTAVLKPAEDTPLSSLNLVKILIEAGLPPGVVNVVMGRGADVGAVLVNDERTRIVSFTGSTAVGRQVGQQAAARFKHCNLELGGKNAILVMADADLDVAVDGSLWGAFGTSGQRCTATSRIVVERAVYAKFLQRMTDRAAELKIGNGLDESRQIGPIVNARQLERVAEYVAIGQKEGARLLVGGTTLSQGELAHGHFFAPTIFADAKPSMRIAQEEIFGPVVTIMPCDGLDEAIAIANGVGYGLSSSLYTANVNAAFRALRDLESGIVYINAPTIGAEVHLPFGGMRNTGNGHRESGMATLDVYSEWKTLYVDYSGHLQRAQIDTQE
ncbi:MAG TPA: aldehyde dehydrogenase family protein [Terriglobales bacterium]|nr:aldehyde dehydrogenase family protein [Terriglobales bacterium]